MKSELHLSQVVIELAKKAELRIIHLASCRCALNGPYDIGTPLPSFDVSVRGGATKLAGPGLFSCGLGVTVSPKDPSNRFVGEIECNFSGQYVVNDAAFFARLTQADLDAFAASSAAINLWPYIREFVGEHARRLGLVPVTLPLLRIGAARPGEPAFNFAVTAQNTSPVSPQQQ